jgi:tripartite-type tricarboxylate transporter receptor subunit TctC
MKLLNCLGLSVALAWCSVPANAADYYSGKTISIYVGSAAGGGYDIYSRAIARHLPRFIPGTPTVIVQNMPGGGGAKAAGYISAVASKDGTAIGAVSPGTVIGPLLDDRAQAQYDPRKLNYLATANSGSRVCVTLARSQTKTFDDARRIKTIMGAGAPGDSTRDYANLLKNTASAKFELVTGYTGTPDILLAMERGEVDGVCGWDWSSLKSQRGDYIRDKKFNILVTAALEPNEELKSMGVPEVWAYMVDDQSKQVTELIVAQQLFGRPFIAPPGTPDNLVAILRSAFSATFKDPEFLADAAKSKLDIVPSDGEKVQAGVARIYAAPKEIVEKAREAIRK